MEKTERVREKTRPIVPEGYSGLRHLVLLASLTMTPVTFFVAALIVWGVPLTALLAIPLGFLLGNLVEYAAHRWPMHRLMKGNYGQRMYRRHAGVHHAMFQYDDMEVRDPREFYHVMMTPTPAIAFMFVMTLIVGGGYLLGGGPFSALLGITLCTYFFSEELLHLSFHLRSTWRGKRWYHRALRRLAEHHRIHHDSRVMRDVNFNIAAPIFDKLLGTSVKTHEMAVESVHAEA